MTQSKSTKEEEKQLELCAISKEVAVERLNKLVEKHQDIFDEYNMWISVINSPIKMVDTEESTSEVAN